MNVKNILFVFFCIALGAFSCTDNEIKVSENITDKEKKVEVEKNKDNKDIEYLDPVDPEEDYQNLIEVIQEYTKILNIASEDGVLSNDEVLDIVKMQEELIKFETDIEVRYTDNGQAKDDYDKYLTEKEKEFDEISEKFFDAVIKAFKCEGAEMIDFN